VRTLLLTMQAASEGHSPGDPGAGSDLVTTDALTGEGLFDRRGDPGK